MAQKFQPGDNVEFQDFEDPNVTRVCKVLSWLEPNDEGFKGAYHVACYYVVSEEDLRKEKP